MCGGRHSMIIVIPSIPYRAFYDPVWVSYVTQPTRPRKTEGSECPPCRRRLCLCCCRRPLLSSSVVATDVFYETHSTCRHAGRYSPPNTLAGPAMCGTILKGPSNFLDNKKAIHGVIYYLDRISVILSGLNIS